MKRLSYSLSYYVPETGSQTKSQTRRARCCILVQTLSVVCAFAAGDDLHAQAPAKSYPVKSLRIIVSLPPAGTTDIVARIVAQKLTEALGQTVIVDNRPGGGTTIGNAVRRARGSRRIYAPIQRLVARDHGAALSQPAVRSGQGSSPR